MTDFESWLKKNINIRKDKNLFRELKHSENLKDFCSNDYLGLACSEMLYNTVHDQLKSLPIKRNGATGSRLLSGNSTLTEEVEHTLAGIFKSEAALILNSGYAANLSVLSALPQRDDTILYDELVHTSIKDGARLSLAHRFSFRHNDLADLEEKIKRSKGHIFIVVESIYSMDGDECPLQELTTLAEKHNATIILDEAHSTGVVGPQGGGLAVALGLEKKIEVRIYTFGKAMGCHGACIAGSASLISYLINFSRPFIYTTALPPHSIIAIGSAFAFLSENISLQDILRERIEFFNTHLSPVHNRLSSNSAIQVVIIPGNENARRASKMLVTQGYDIRPILSPTVKQGTERLRICLHTFNANDDIIELAKIIASLGDAY